MKHTQKLFSIMPYSKLIPLISFSLLIHFVQFRQVDSSCDQVFLSTQNPSGGKFEAPLLSSSTSINSLIVIDKNLTTTAANNDTQKEKKPTHCLYKFIAEPGERVVLDFDYFSLRGDEPECASEYLDIYITLESGQDVNDISGRKPAEGRFCTSILPGKTVSLHNLLVLTFYSDVQLQTGRQPLFSGFFSFLKSKPYDQIGPPLANSLCNHNIYGTLKREGDFQSVTYPGVYLKGLRCSYKFIGEVGQRIRLEFLDLDLYSGGSHCPLDIIKVFDGQDETAPIISTICGSHRSLIMFSTRETLLVTFTTIQREDEVQNRGFSAYFEFSEKFVNPTFTKGSNAKHIRGSECDQRIISLKGTKGLIVSPDPGHHPDAICRYIFEGLQTSLDYEKVHLKFTEFDLKTHSSHSLVSSTTESSLSFNTLPSSQSSGQELGAANTSAEQCTDNYVRLYTSEQKPDQKQDPNDYDYVFCGSELPPGIESDAVSLLMEYNSGSIGGNFKADYSFIPDFRIPGIQINSTCDYLYRSETNKMGTFNSPRYPSWYINDMNCSYTFTTKSDEALLLQFISFKMSNSFNEKVLGYNEACKSEDLVEISELSFDSSYQKVLEQHSIGTYCGTTTPGPILSYKPLRVSFRTNSDQVHYGFLGVYNFYSVASLKMNEFVTNCGGQIYSSQRMRSGSILSPETYRPETYEKRNHICSWNITARPSYKISLSFNRFELEGSPTVRGCITASVRLIIGKTKTPIELCGSLNLQANDSANNYVSENEWLSLTFISTTQASGSNGFAASWTEVKRAS